MIKKLYITGNGFDLHHDLQTSYCAYSKYLQENFEKLYAALTHFITLPVADENLWADFESNLSKLDIDQILDENSGFLPDYQSEKFKNRDRYAFPDEMLQWYEMLTDGLFDTFTDFIQQAKFPKRAYSRKIELDQSATFLNFNFTKTLEKVYGIDAKVCCNVPE